MPIGPAPPSLYGIQRQGAGSSASGGGFDLDTALNDLLSRLQLPEPEPVKPAPLPAKILMGLGDILNARAAALLRQPATESALSHQTEREDAQRQRSQRTAEGNRQVRNQAVTSLYSKKLEMDEQARRDKQDALDEEMRERRKSEAEMRRFILEDIDELTDKGIALPPDVDPQTISFNSWVARKKSLIGDKTLSAAEEASTILKLQERFPGLEITATVNPKDGEFQYHFSRRKPKSESDTGGRKPGDLTEKQALEFTALTGKDFTAMTPAQRAAAMKEYGDIKRSWAELTAGEDKEYRGLVKIQDKVEELMNSMPDLTAGKWFATTQEEADWRAKAENLDGMIRLLRAGTAVSAQEENFRKYLKAALGRLDRNNLAALNELSGTYNDELSLFETSNRIPDGQRRAMRVSVRSEGQKGVFVGDDPDPSRYEEVWREGQ